MQFLRTALSASPQRAFFETFEDRRTCVASLAIFFGGLLLSVFPLCFFRVPCSRIVQAGTSVFFLSYIGMGGRVERLQVFLPPQDLRRLTQR